MTRTRTTSYLRTARSAGDLARGALAALALVTFVVGVPVALSVVAPVHLPTSWPTWAEAGAAVLRPDDGSLLLGVLTLVAWVAWVSFALSVVVEVIAGIRDLPAPSIPMLGLSQHAAATLVTTAGLLMVSSVPPFGPGSSVSASAAPHSERVERATTTPRHLDLTSSSGPRTNLPRIAVTMTEVPPTARESATPVVARADAASDPHPMVTVERGDSLWSLAERHLGSGQRYAEIRDLNVGRPQPDGRTLTDTHWVYPGWRLRLPLDATAVPAASAAEVNSGVGDRAADAEKVVEVEPGDTLWGIAAESLGGGERYSEVYDLNAGVSQEDGRTLSNPDLIRPGWELTLPLDLEHPADSAPLVDRVPDPRPTIVPGPAPIAAAAPDLAPVSIDAHDDAGNDGDSNSNDAPVGTDDASDDEPAGYPMSRLFLGLTGLAAVGVIGELSRRRHLQHRARRTGERIALPEPGSPADDAERTLRGAATPLSIDQIKGALLNLASRCYSAERDLPRIGVVLLSERTLDLHLVEDDPAAVHPFTAVGPRTWSAPTESVAADPPIEDDPGRPEPYPALVTLGHTDEATILCNLEAAGTLTVAGEADATQDVVRALVAELATSDLTGRIGLITGPEFTDLAGASDTARLQSSAAPDAVATQLADRNRALGAALAASGAEDTLEARSERTGDDLWLPVVYVETDDRDLIRDGCAPWSGSILITTGPAGGGWDLAVHDDGVAVLSPLGGRLHPQRLAAGDLDRLTELLAVAQVDDTDQDGLRPPHQSGPVEADIIDALAALPTRDQTQPDPLTVTKHSTGTLRINVLGPIQIVGVPDGDTRLSRRSTELLVYLALHGSATGPELDEALWHGRRVDSQTRNSLLYRTRQHVGVDNLPIVDSDGRYCLGPGVSCDWGEFSALARAGLAVGPGGSRSLGNALDLVRDRPFLGIAGTDYTWAEHHIQQMISTIADVAHVRSQLLLNVGDHRRALKAATRGLLAEPCSELLYGDAIASARARGDLTEADRLRERLQALLGELDPEYVPA